MSVVVSDDWKIFLIYFHRQARLPYLAAPVGKRAAICHWEEWFYRFIGAILTRLWRNKSYPAVDYNYNRKRVPVHAAVKRQKNDYRQEGEGECA